MPNPMVVEKILWREKGAGVAASGKIPQDAEFFKDHFPGFPVLPGVLALEMLKQTAECYLREEKKKAVFAITKVRGVKFSDFLKPGDRWESRLELVSEQEAETQWRGVLLHDGKKAVSANFHLKEVFE